MHFCKVALPKLCSVGVPQNVILLNKSVLLQLNKFVMLLEIHYLC
jgi:hypothetical protein